MKEKKPGLTQKDLVKLFEFARGRGPSLKVAPQKPMPKFSNFEMARRPDQPRIVPPAGATKAAEEAIKEIKAFAAGARGLHREAKASGRKLDPRLYVQQSMAAGEFGLDLHRMQEGADRVAMRAQYAEAVAAEPQADKKTDGSRPNLLARLLRRWPQGQRS